MTRNGIKIQNSGLSGAITPEDRRLPQLDINFPCLPAITGFGFTLAGSKSRMTEHLVFGAILKAREQMNALELLKAQGLFEEAEHGEQYRTLTRLLSFVGRGNADTVSEGLCSLLSEDVASVKAFSGYLEKIRVKSANNTARGAYPTHSIVIDSYSDFATDDDEIVQIPEAELAEEENALGQDYKTKNKLAKVTAAMKQKQRTKADLLSRNPFFNRQK